MEENFPIIVALPTKPKRFDACTDKTCDKELFRTTDVPKFDVFSMTKKWLPVFEKIGVFNEDSFFLKQSNRFGSLIKKQKMAQKNGGILFQWREHLHEKSQRGGFEKCIGKQRSRHFIFVANFWIGRQFSSSILNEH